MPFAQFIVAQKVIQGIHPGCTTTELDNLAAETAASMTTHHPDYALVRSLLIHARTALPFALRALRQVAIKWLNAWSLPSAARCPPGCRQPSRLDPGVLLRHVRNP